MAHAGQGRASSNDSQLVGGVASQRQRKTAGALKSGSQPGLFAEGDW